jgi:phosphatidylinositol dimannoside acyltransferase
MSRNDIGTRLGELRGRAVDLGYAAGWGAVKAIPAPVAAHGFRSAGDIARRRDGRGVRQLRRNLRRVVGADAPESDLDRVVHGAMRSYARYWLETFRLPTMDLARVAATTQQGTEGIENLDAAMAAGRGTVVALPHMGNWDVAAVWLVDHGVPFTTVVERLWPESLYRRFVAYREGLGMEVIPLTGGSAAPAGMLTERLTAGRLVALVADRDMTRAGVDVTFFGETARFPAGPAMLAAQTGAALLPVSLWFTSEGWGQRIGAPVDLRPGRLRDQVRHGTQAIADWFATEIAEHPTDWHMLQRLWVADLPEHGTD